MTNTLTQVLLGVVFLSMSMSIFIQSRLPKITDKCMFETNEILRLLGIVLIVTDAIGAEVVIVNIWIITV